MSTDRWFEVDRAGFAANLTDEDRVKAVVELVQNEMLTDAYSAGVVDSDGCITIKRRKHSASDGGSAYFQLLVVVGQTGDQVPPVLDLLQRAYGGALQRRQNTPPRFEPIPADVLVVMRTFTQDPIHHERNLND